MLVDLKISKKVVARLTLKLTYFTVYKTYIFLSEKFDRSMFLLNIISFATCNIK